MNRELKLPYGSGQMQATMARGTCTGLYLPAKEAEGGSGQSMVYEALRRPVGAPPLAELVAKDDQVVIVTSDHTRPCPNAVLLPPLVEELSRAGVPDSQITIVIALGLHRKMSEAELEKSVGEEIYRRVRVINHDCNDVVSLGTTSRGTPVEFFRPVVEADFRICVGNVEFHYFAGFSGGAKAIMPGAASAAAVKANHSHMIENGAAAAQLVDNPVREDLEEAVDMLGAHYILNVIVDAEQRIRHACAGDLVLAHRVLCESLIEEGLVQIPHRVDLAVVSAGGTPKDIDLYQAQKALDNCANGVRLDGVIVLVAECTEGYGNKTFEQWMTSGKEPSDLLADLKQEFVLGGHKAAAIAKVAQEMTIILVSQVMARENMVGITVVDSLEKALDEAYKRLDTDFTYAVFPLGASTLPKVQSEV
ncbi:MAG: nickel-dependent lactate racemase [Firmicutes bacterium]|nr:nickel-dependent lactate racemase [Bacillota bacterium]